MRERINRLARGIIDSSVPELVIKPERIEGILSPGESVRGEFSVQSGETVIRVKNYRGLIEDILNYIKRYKEKACSDMKF